MSMMGWLGTVLDSDWPCMSKSHKIPTVLGDGVDRPEVSN
jgi:hypothetical protein